MSRSRKKTPKTGFTTAVSEKSDKQNANRKLRRKVKVQVNGDKEVFSELREVSNVWAFDKDGKWFNSNPDWKDLRK